jgi:succinate dehydrogenase / fumarate reductase membrane anchor subunit
VSSTKPAGSGHWLAQRISAITLIPLGLWFIFSLSTRADLSRASWLAFVAVPWHAAILVLFLLVLLFHSYLGVRVVIEDYVHERWRERALHMLSRVLHVAAGAFGVFAVIRIAAGAGA